MAFDWPGNVRELENFVARCIALGSGPTLRDEDRCLSSGGIGEGILPEVDTQRLAAVERHTIVKVLKETNGDRVAAAGIRDWQDNDLPQAQGIRRHKRSS